MSILLVYAIQHEFVYLRQVVISVGAINGCTLSVCTLKALYSVHVSLTEFKRTSSLSLPTKSSSGWASYRFPLLLWIWSFSISIFSWSPWPCPRLGECGWDRKVNTSSCRMSWGSYPSLLSQLLQTCRSQDKPGPIVLERESAAGGQAPELSLAGLQLRSSKKTDYRTKQKQGNFNLSRNKFSLWNIHCCTWILMNL